MCKPYLVDFHDTSCYMLSYLDASVIHSGNDNFRKRYVIHEEQTALW